MGGNERKSGEDSDHGGDAGVAGRRAPRVMASAPSVVQQARLMDSAGTAWHAVKYGNLEMITKLFPNCCNVYARGPVGENVLHTAMLLNTPSTLAIARYLVKLYGPTLVNCPFQDRKSPQDPPSAYEGQTALHIAIVNRDFDMVKFLVQAGADIRARAWGLFFSPGGPMYYGEYPLSFAACTGQKEVVAHLRRHGANVNRDRDVHGNTALHMCVVHDQPDMYDFLVEYCAASDAVRNYSGLTPLVLSAQLGKTAMFQHIYNRRRRAFYTFGRVTSYSLALREIDTVQDEEEYVPNALEVVLRKGHLDMLEEPLISTLLQHKWEAFARTQFFIHFLGYLLLEVSQTILIWLISNKERWNGVERASQEYVGLSLAIIMTLFEIMDYVDWSTECYHRRLTTVAAPPYQPPLCPMPGEQHDVREGRQGLFHRISQRMIVGLSSGLSGSGMSGGSGAAGHQAAGGAGGAPARLPSRPSVRQQLPERLQSKLGGGGGGGVSAGPVGEAFEGPGGGGAASPRPGTPTGAAALRAQQQQQQARVQGPAVGQDGDDDEEDDVVSVGVRRSMQLQNASSGSVSALLGAGVTPQRLAQGAPPVDSPRQQQQAQGQGQDAAAGVHPLAHRSVSFHGLGSGVGGVSTGSGITASAAAAATAAAGAPGAAVAAARGEIGVSGAAPTTESMLQRQRTRARSGGGDLPSAISSLKRVNTAPHRHRGDLEADELLSWEPGQHGGAHGMGTAAAFDVEAGGMGGGAPGAGGGDPHKSHLRAMLETTTEGFRRMLSDPWLFIWHLHLLLTFMHFITWQTTYGGVHGSGPSSRRVREFDDVVVSMMGLSGWLAVIYFFRGFKPTGKLAVILERCLVDVVRFVSLYILWNIGFTLAFFTMSRGTLYVTDTPNNKEVTNVLNISNGGSNISEEGFSTIGWGMMSLINLGLGLGLDEYHLVCNLGHQVTSVFCTIYYLAYMATSAILLLNMLTAMIIRTYNTAQKAAEAHWRRRWASYTVKAERRMPAAWVRRLRLGQPAWDPKTHRAQYSHVFEMVEGEDRDGKGEADRGALDAQIRAVGELLDGLKRQRGGGDSRGGADRPSSAGA